MFLYRSNRTESLVDALAQIVTTPVGPPAVPECIVVEGRGMARWLAMQLACRLGVWANPDFPFPRRLVERVVAAVCGPADAVLSPFEPDILRWTIAELLPGLATRPEFAPVRHYLGGGSVLPGARLLPLAARLATTFDQYVVFRPELVRSWETGSDRDWQAVLWRAIRQRHGRAHAAQPIEECLRLLRGGAPPGADFPRRVSLFGLTTVPPLHLRLLAALAQHVEVHVFLLSPSDLYWSATRRELDVVRAAMRRGDSAERIAAELKTVEGHPLLASLGRVGRDFQEVLESEVDYHEPVDSLYRDPSAPGETGGPTTPSLLRLLQSDLLRSVLPHGSAGDCGAGLNTDVSIRVHACHSPMREVEVLHDQLLAAFDADATLAPRDIVVMCPTIDDYAPLVDAVFGATGEGRARIPYHVADRRVRAADDAVDAFLRILEVVRGRFTAPDVMDLLRAAPVRQHFEIADEELETVQSWVAHTRVRWAMDRADRVAAGQPDLEQYTWRFGLDRLLLGYALAGEATRLYGDVLPFDDIEGTDAALLGRFADYCERLFSVRRAVGRARTVGDWGEQFQDMVEDLLASTDETADQMRAVRAAIDSLVAEAAAGGFTGEVELDTMRRLLEDRLERDAPGRGFLSGGVTFCAMVPMRSIPFRVVCLLGMNYGQFPRSRRPLGFDRMAERSRAGDRSPRDDDRYLFLEALLSARERILITYVGRQISDNKSIPPSPVVTELLDVLDDMVGAVPAEGERPSAQLVTQHPLQSFNPRYFDKSDCRLFSYATHACDGARALAVATKSAPPPFVSGPLPIIEAPSPIVTLDELIRFLEHPVRAFAQRRLALSLAGEGEPLESFVPLSLNKLESWSIGEALVARGLAGESLDDAVVALRATGTLPPGTFGIVEIEKLRPVIEACAAAGRQARRGPRCAPVPIDIDVGGCRLVGHLSDLWPQGQVRVTFSRVRGRPAIALWVSHLVLNALPDAPCPRASVLVGRSPNAEAVTGLHLGPVSDATALLAGLVRLYRLGQQVPLPLFPRSSWAYAEQRQTGDDAKARAAARKVYGPSSGFEKGAPPEGNDPYVAQIFARSDPLAASFAWPVDQLAAGVGLNPRLSFDALAMAVFGPLLAHRREER